MATTARHIKVILPIFMTLRSCLAFFVGEELLFASKRLVVLIARLLRAGQSRDCYHIATSTPLAQNHCRLCGGLSERAKAVMRWLVLLFL